MITLWTLRKASREVSCQVRLTIAGIDLAICWDRQEGIGRVFKGEEEALAWAQEQKLEFVEKGWKVVEEGRKGRRH